MANSAKYTSTTARIDQIGVNLLPVTNPAGTYTDKDQDLIRSYCLLCHAEFESYIENITLEVVKKAFDKWQLNKQLISPIIFHLAFNYTSKIKDIPYSLIVKAFLDYEKTIKNNHGIKENNLNNFFKPIGYEMDSVLKISLNSFGGTRGEIAHTSFSTQQPLDPVIEKTNVQQILLGLGVFDDELVKYESQGILSRSPESISWAKFNFIDRIKILFTGNK